MTELVNLTPHALRIRLTDDNRTEPLVDDIVLEPVKPAARIEQSSAVCEPINGIPVVRSGFGDIIDLPEPRAGVVYVVSLPVAQQAAARGRTDVVSPDTSPKGGAVRYQDEARKGQIFAVRGFQRF